jgi:hypothetical protein
MKQTVVLLLFLVLIWEKVLARDRSDKTKFLTNFDAQDPTIRIADQLPFANRSIEYKLMPYVGNGHLASTIFNNAVYLNGLYNGHAGESHRARVPTVHNFFFISPVTNNQTFARQQYVLDLKRGVFVEQLEDDMVIIERRIFAHQFYNRLLISHIDVRRKETATMGAITIRLAFTASYTSEDFVFENLNQQNADYYILKGETREIEFEEFQKAKSRVFMYFNEPRDLVLGENENSLVRVFISSVDVNETPAKEEFELAWQLVKEGNAMELLKRHETAFSNIWSFGRIETDNFELQSTIFSSYYYLLSSLPALSHYGTLNPFYGLSPGSMSRGSLYQDYQGHSFWDTGIKANLITIPNR